MKRLLKLLKWLLILFVLLNLAILISGKTYLYKGFMNTYLKGRVSADIDEYRIFENRIVKAGAPDEWSFGKDFNTKQIPEKYIPDFERMKTIAYLIIKDDSIRFERYWNNYSDTSHTSSFSMAKSFISILVGIAIEEGKIKSLDQPVSDFLPEFSEGEKKKVTLRHLVTMCSGIDFDESYVNPIGFAAEAYYGDDLRDLVFRYDAVEEPGKHFKYLSGNTQLLGFVLSKVTGMSVSEYASEKLWKPIQAQHDAFWSLDHENGDEKAYCCFNSNARDFAKVGQLFLDSGRWNGKQVVPEKYVLESIQPAPVLDGDSENKRYGYSWWLFPDYKGKNIFYARGILGQYIIVIPEEKMVIVRLGKKRELSSVNGHPTDLYWYIDAALEIVHPIGIETIQNTQTLSRPFQQSVHLFQFFH